MSLTKDLRPKNLEEFFGQEIIKKQLKIVLESAKKRDTVLDHLLFSGPPGLGKTSLAQILSTTLNYDLKILHGANLQKKNEFMALLATLKNKTLIFIDEIHRVHPVIEEILYIAMEDFRLDLLLGQGLKTKTLSLNLEPFTLIGATTRAGDLSKPLRDRFGLHFVFDYYTDEELLFLLKNNSLKMNLHLEEKAEKSLLQRCRRTPRLVNRLLKRIKDYAISCNIELITEKHLEEVFSLMQLDSHGLEPLDKKILYLLKHQYKSKPVGLETIAATLGEHRRTLEEIYEPYLLKEGLIVRTPKGRMITKKGEMYSD